MGNLHNTKEWKKRRDEVVKDECEWCDETEGLSVHHLEWCLNYEEYMTTDKVITLCKKCHWHAEQGRVLCNGCKKHYHDKNYDYCYNCNMNEDEEDIIDAHRRMEREW